MIKYLNCVKLRICPCVGKVMNFLVSIYISIFGTNGFKLFPGTVIMIS